MTKKFVVKKMISGEYFSHDCTWSRECSYLFYFNTKEEAEDFIAKQSYSTYKIEEVYVVSYMTLADRMRSDRRLRSRLV